MKIKDYKCNCQSTDFTFGEKNKSHLGIYCTKCGKWYKWADKNDRNLYEIVYSGRVYKLTDEENK